MGLFRFHPKNPDVATHLMEQGILPWWTYRSMHLAFWRPVSAMTHWLDYQLWPNQPGLMHAHSLLWFGLLIATVTLLYRHLLPTPHSTHHRQLAPFLIAGWLYALDDAHGFAVGWLANRNIILATLFGCGALLTYHKWRSTGRQAGLWLTPLLLLLGLLSAESAVAILSYFLAYALFLDRTPHRWPALGPSLIIILGWQYLYRYLGYGATGTAYTDPLHDPGLYLFALLERAPILLLGQFVFPLPEIYNLLFGPARIVMWSIAVVIAGVILWVLWKAVPNPAVNQLSQFPDAQLTRFWLAGMLGALLPASVIFPASRMLFFIGLGAMGLIAQFLSRHVFIPIGNQISSLNPPKSPLQGGTCDGNVMVKASPLVGGRLEGGQLSTACPLFISGKYIKPSTSKHLYRFIGLFFIVIHLIIAPLTLPLSAYSPAFFGNIEPAVLQLPLTEQQTAVIVAAPSSYYTGFIPYLRQRTGQSVPDSVRVLAATLYPVEVERLEAKTLAIRPRGGYFLGLESLFRGQGHQLKRNQRLELSDITIEITDLTSRGNPIEAHFHFVVPLEDPSLTWFYWQQGEYKPFTLPAIGQTITLNSVYPLDLTSIDR